jgi:hypothetical protein
VNGIIQSGVAIRMNTKIRELGKLGAGKSRKCKTQIPIVTSKLISMLLKKVLRKLSMSNSCSSILFESRAKGANKVDETLSKENAGIKIMAKIPYSATELKFPEKLYKYFGMCQISATEVVKTRDQKPRLIVSAPRVFKCSNFGMRIILCSSDT